MMPYEIHVWQWKASPHQWRVRHQNNCMIARQRRNSPFWRQQNLVSYLRQELALAKAWRVFWRPVLP
jgi:hypothetical protein